LETCAFSLPLSVHEKYVGPPRRKHPQSLLQVQVAAGTRIAPNGHSQQRLPNREECFQLDLAVSDLPQLLQELQQLQGSFSGPTLVPERTIRAIVRPALQMKMQLQQNQEVVEAICCKVAVGVLEPKGLCCCQSHCMGLKREWKEEFDPCCLAYLDRLSCPSEAGQCLHCNHDERHCTVEGTHHVPKKAWKLLRDPFPGFHSPVLTSPCKGHPTKVAKGSPAEPLEGFQSVQLGISEAFLEVSHFHICVRPTMTIPLLVSCGTRSC